MLSSSKEDMKNLSFMISLFHIIPDFALKHSLKVIFEEHRFEKIQERLGHDKDKSEYWEIRSNYDSVFDLSQFYGFIFAITIALFSILMFIVENSYYMEKYGNFCNKLQLCNCRKKNKSKDPEDIPLSDQNTIDPDVNRENLTVDDIVQNRKESDHAMVVSKLEKEYDSIKAVKGVSFTIKRGECFGLLGTNGAGKTTTFEMMTANLPKSGGKCFLNGCDIEKNKFAYKQQYGYCPQQDALNDYMTSYEMLKYMLTIRGVHEKDIDEKVRHWLKKMDIEKYQDIPIVNYSGGTKRKLNTAMAMVSFSEIF